MKISIKLLMMALVLSVFATGCSKDDDTLPIQNVAGTYKGTLTIIGMDSVYQDVQITVGTPVNNSAVVSIPEGTIALIPIPIVAPCNVTSDNAKYSLSAALSVPIPDVGTVSITVKNSSSINKAGKADLDIEVALPEGVPPGGTLVIKFDGQKE
jgi:hypothetical protein